MTISAERLAQIEAISDADIDYSDIPEMDAAFFQTARLIVPGDPCDQAKSTHSKDDSPPHPATNCP